MNNKYSINKKLFFYVLALIYRPPLHYTPLFMKFNQVLVLDSHKNRFKRLRSLNDLLLLNRNGVGNLQFDIKI